MVYTWWEFSRRGPSNWNLDAKGIAFHGARDDRRYLRWRDVERVRWSEQGVRLLGRGERIDLAWKQLPPDLRREAIAALLHFLGRDFQLPAPPGSLTRSEFMLFLAKLVGFSFWVAGAAFASKYVAVFLLSILLPALFSLFGPLLRDEAILTPICVATYLASWVGLALPVRLLNRTTTWFDRRAYCPIRPTRCP